MRTENHQLHQSRIPRAVSGIARRTKGRRGNDPDRPGTQIQPGLLVSRGWPGDVEKGTNNSANDPLEALIAIRDLKEKTLILLRDFHLFLQDPNPILIRQLKDVLQMAKTKSKTLIILGCRMVLPPELERELTVIEFALPGKEELRAVLGGIMESANIKPWKPKPRRR